MHGMKSSYFMIMLVALPTKILQAYSWPCWPTLPYISLHYVTILTNNVPLLAACMLHIHKICIGWGPTGMAILEHLITVFPDGRMQFQHILEKLSCHCMCYAQAFQKSTYMLCVITMSYPSNSQNPMTSTSHIYVVHHQFDCAVCKWDGLRASNQTHIPHLTRGNPFVYCNDSGWC